MCLALEVPSRGVKRRSLLAAGLALPAVGVLGAGKAAAAPAPPFVIAGVRIFDGSKLLLERGHVLVASGRIVSVLDGVVPKGLPVHDGRGKTLLPGLIDGHVHYRTPARTDAPRFGVTTELDMLSDPTWHGPIREQRRSYAPTRDADLWTAGWWATVPGGWGTDAGIELPVVEPDTDLEAWLATRRAEGSDHLKLALEDVRFWDGVQLPVLSAAQTNGLVAAAKRVGMRSVAHATREEMARRGLTAGVTGLVHMFTDKVASPDLINLAARTGAFVTPTLVLWSALTSAENPASNAVARDPRVAPFLSEAQRELLNTPWGFELPGRLEIAQQNVQALHKAGVPITAGTDGGVTGMAHGVSLIVEIELLAAAGLTPTEALTAATATPAARWGLTDRGRIQPGKRADLVLVNGNPTRDITALRDIHTVWRNGTEIAREV